VTRVQTHSGRRPPRHGDGVRVQCLHVHVHSPLVVLPPRPPSLRPSAYCRLAPTPDGISAAVELWCRRAALQRWTGGRHQPTTSGSNRAAAGQPRSRHGTRPSGTRRFGVCCSVLRPVGSGTPRRSGICCSHQSGTLCFQ
jgi:hypothetical protein